MCPLYAATCSGEFMMVSLEPLNSLNQFLLHDLKDNLQYLNIHGMMQNEEVSIEITNLKTNIHRIWISSMIN